MGKWVVYLCDCHHLKGEKYIEKGEREREREKERERERESRAYIKKQKINVFTYLTANN